MDVRKHKVVPAVDLHSVVGSRLKVDEIAVRKTEEHGHVVIVAGLDGP